MITNKIKGLVLLVFLAGVGTIKGTPVPTACINDTDCVLAGLDYFRTLPGTFFTINGVPVPLLGIPGLKGSDTIVQRLGNIDVLDRKGGDTQTVDLHMTELNLTGVDPSCPATGTPCDVFIHLTPGTPTLGNLMLTQTVDGEGPVEGTYTSFFDVFFDLSFTDLNKNPLPCDPNGDTVCHQELTLNGSGAWTDDNGPFFIVGGVVNESHPSPPGVHDAKQITPEPVSSVLFGTGVAWLLGLVKKRQRRG